MSVDYSDLGIRIKRRREELRMSQAELASRAELSTQHISNVENARSKIGLDKLVTISNVLECSVDELLCGSMRTGGRSVYNDEVAGIIDDFSDTKMRILPEFLRNYSYIYKLLKQNVDESREE
ncbi:MAG: helix-turn-helix transcriptional regulator [Lachnospiraceae bacterium]|nr:helix-turn-helix transcriptional regulator [Lachnospiraceae bacterium]